MILRQIIILLAVVITCGMRAEGTYVVDEATGEPLARASVFDRNGRFLGLTSGKGRLPYASEGDYPLTVRFIGYEPLTVGDASAVRVRMRESVSELPEVVVNSSVPKALHILGYVREYSTLTTYRDTVTMFREKTVDFMIPSNRRSKFKGWTLPRMLASRSYYQFRNDEGLDSVSASFPEHFSWSDWVGVTADATPIPVSLHGMENATDTLRGKWCFRRIWRKSGDRVYLDADILADTLNFRLVPHLASFIDRKDVDFRRLDVRYIYDNCDDKEATADNLSAMSYNIEAKGRGRNLERLFRSHGPAYVDSYVELYVIDKEYIPIKEAREWEKFAMNGNGGILVPEGLPELPAPTRELIARVENIDNTEARLNTKIDPRIGHLVVLKWDILSRLKRMAKGFVGLK